MYVKDGVDGSMGFGPSRLAPHGLPLEFLVVQKKRRTIASLCGGNSLASQ